MGAVLFIIGFVTLSGGASNASGMGFGVIATLVGGFLFFQSLRRVRMEQRLRRAGIVTEATVTAVTESNFSVNRVLQWVIRYRYADYRGGSYEGQSGYISAEEAVNWKVGDIGTIRFDHRRPQESVWMGEKKIAETADEGTQDTERTISGQPHPRLEEKQSAQSRSFYKLAKQSPWVFTGGFFLLFSLVFFRLSAKEQGYEKEGVIVQGTILGKTFRKGTSGSGRSTGTTSSHYVMYRFTTQEGQTFESKYDVLPGTYRELREGGPVEVEYLPGSPEVNRIPGQRAKPYTYRYIGRFLLLASATALLSGLRKAYVQFRLLRQTPSIDAGRAIE